MKILEVQTTEENLEEITEIIGLSESLISLKNTCLPSKYFTLYPQLNMFLNRELANKVQQRKFEAVKFKNLV